jgi:hypothetical protein
MSPFAVRLTIFTLRLSLPYSVPSARHADVSIKKPRRNLLSQRGLQCRGDWIRTSDLLNPIQAR